MSKNVNLTAGELAVDLELAENGEQATHNPTEAACYTTPAHIQHVGPDVPNPHSWSKLFRDRINGGAWCVCTNCEVEAYCAWWD